MPGICRLTIPTILVEVFRHFSDSCRRRSRIDYVISLKHLKVVSCFCLRRLGFHIQSSGKCCNQDHIPVLVEFEIDWSIRKPEARAPRPGTHGMMHSWMNGGEAFETFTDTITEEVVSAKVENIEDPDAIFINFAQLRHGSLPTCCESQKRANE